MFMKIIEIWMEVGSYMVEAFFLNFFEVPTKSIWGEGGCNSFAPQVRLSCPHFEILKFSVFLLLLLK